MGIKKGDEYSVITSGSVEGFKDEREVGLVLIKDVGPEVSTGKVLYSSVSLSKDAQLREIPRLGFDAEPYFHLVNGTKLSVLDINGNGGETGSNFVLGMRLPLSRGFYDERPFVGVQVPVNGIRNIGTAFMVPICVTVGGEYNLHLGRLTLTPWGALGASYIYVSEALSGYSRDTSDIYIPHLGFQAYVSASYLLSRDMRLYAEGGYEYWLSLASWLYSNYGGVSFGGGVAFKL